PSARPPLPEDSKTGFPAQTDSSPPVWPGEPPPSVLGQAGAGLALVGLDGRWQWVNPVFCRILGLSAVQLVGQGVEEVVHPQDMEVYRSRLKSLLDENSQPGPTDLRVIGGGGTPAWLHWTPALALKPDGTPDGFIFVAEDITLSKNTERLREEFISNLSHELRTPLTSILGAIGLALGTLKGQLDPGLVQLLEMGKRNGDQLLLLVNDLLDIQQIENGNLMMGADQVNMADLVAYSVSIHRPDADRKQISLKKRVLAEDVYVMGDWDRLLQVMSNLISNAVRFSPPGQAVEIALAHEKNTVSVSVKDHGAGIPEDFTLHVFQKFIRAKNSTAREKTGSGLGLSIAKGIVESHQGTIGFASRPGEGATFTFSLPAYQPAISETLFGQAPPLKTR
ncbi:MAG: PAS domain-containing sensor histidine kinase, partial [Deltaproteobacteria bacterium]|nr:PAS domain-containing sensor histidine kinase [Deltaproteobacteria bacterium]